MQKATIAAAIAAILGLAVSSTVFAADTTKADTKTEKTTETKKAGKVKKDKKEKEVKTTETKEPAAK
jgi:uncharacterized membrane protein